jgi:hypothetical protein
VLPSSWAAIQPSSPGAGRSGGQYLIMVDYYRPPSASPAHQVNVSEFEMGQAFDYLLASPLAARTRVNLEFDGVQ